MKTTISVIKADVGSIGGHIKPSAKLKAAIEHHVRDKGKKLLIDLYVSSTGGETAWLTALSAWTAIVCLPGSITSVHAWRTSPGRGDATAATPPYPALPGETQARKMSEAPVNVCSFIHGMHGRRHED